MVAFNTHWTKLLASTTDGGDILASIREAAINHYLEKHFAGDKAKYSVIKSMVGKVDVGGTTKDVPIKLVVSAKTPLIVDFAPLAGAPTIGGAWNAVDVPDATPNLSQGNVRIRVDQVAFSVEWQSVFQPGVKFTWSPSPILFEAEARIDLRTIAEPVEEARHVLHLQPVHVRFARPSRAILEKELDDLVKRLPPADAAIVVKHAIDKFDELLVLALNTAAVELAPRFATSIEIPVPVVAQQRIVPRALLISDDIATVSLGLDDNRLRQDAGKALARAATEVSLALEEDIEAAGGFRALVCRDVMAVDWDSIDSIRDVEILPEAEISAKLKKTHEVSSRQSARAAREIGYWEGRSTGAPAAAAVADGVGVAINEYFLDSVAATFAQSSSDCTDCLNLQAVRGRACYWLRLYDADISIGDSGGVLVVGGAVGVDIGGKLEACVRKFWDCSWKWVCEELRMAVKGRPGVDITLIANKYVAFSAKITGRLQLETNLPFPFDKIISAMSAIVWEGVKAILNAFLTHIQIVIVPPRIDIPQQKTGISLSNFTPAFYSYGAGKDSKDRYASYGVGITAS